MSLTRARDDWKRFLNTGGFEESLTLTPTGGAPVPIVGLAVKHHNSIDTDGLQSNTQNARVSLIESYLVEQGLTVRDSAGEVNMRNWLVSYPDSSGAVKNYVISETIPDEMVGVITCILGDYGG